MFGSRIVAAALVLGVALTGADRHHGPTSHAAPVVAAAVTLAPSEPSHVATMPAVQAHTAARSCTVAVKLEAGHDWWTPGALTVDGRTVSPDFMAALGTTADGWPVAWPASYRGTLCTLHLSGAVPSHGVPIVRRDGTYGTYVGR